MAVNGKPTFDLEVEGIGAFTFRHRTMRDQFRIEGEAARFLGGPCDDQALHSGAVSFATLLILTVESPPGWDIEQVDPLDKDALEQVFEVARRLREVEATFRPGVGGKSQ